MVVTGNDGDHRRPPDDRAWWSALQEGSGKTWPRSTRQHE
jgi:hypothetical protein